MISVPTVDHVIADLSAWFDKEQPKIGKLLTLNPTIMITKSVTEMCSLQLFFLMLMLKLCCTTSSQLCCPCSSNDKKKNLLQPLQGEWQHVPHHQRVDPDRPYVLGDFKRRREKFKCSKVLLHLATNYHENRYKVFHKKVWFAFLIGP